MKKKLIYKEQEKELIEKLHAEMTRKGVFYNIAVKPYNGKTEYEKPVEWLILG